MSKSQVNKMVRFADYVSPTDAAEIIGCTDGRIYQMLRAGDFRDTILVGKRRFLIARKEVQKVAKNPAKTGRPRKSLAS